MPTLYNRSFTPDELRRYTGTLDQIAGVQMVELADGKSRGMRAAQVWTGSGLRFTILLDRGMDIGAAEYGGVPLAWLHPALGTPDFYEPQEYGWTRTFGGGLVTTGGLVHFGQPETDNGERYGLHGRVSHLPASDVCVSRGWNGDQYELSVEGGVRQSVIFGENLLLRRRISTALGSDRLVIEDTLRNDGFRPNPYMLLYHCNFGFPIVSPASLLHINGVRVIPRGDASAPWAQDFERFSEPDPDFNEQVFFHTPRTGADGCAAAHLFNPDINLGVCVRFRTAELPALTEWKMMGAGEYVCGLEPCTAHEAPRALLRDQGKLKIIEPGEEIHFFVEISVIHDITTI